MAYELPPDGSGPKRLRTSSVASEAPVASELQEDEICLNTADGLLYFKDSNGGVASLGVSAVSKVTGLQDALDAKVGVGFGGVNSIVYMPAADFATLDPKVAGTLYLLGGVTTGDPSVYIGSFAIAAAP